MARFHELEVTDIKKTIRDAVVVTLKPADAAAFAFTQGQYLTFRRDFDGEELRRSYSICAGLDDGILQVGIKRVDGGAFSTWANEDLKIGDRIEAMPPMGRFHTPLDPDAGRTYVGFAGGSGITPVLSILKSTLAREPRSTFTLVYANRGVATIMFREELEDLKNTYMGRLAVIHVLETDAQDIDLFTGRIDEAKVGALMRSGFLDAEGIDTAFICGPEPMMLGIAVDASKELSVLDAARAGDLDAPYSCKAGVCSTCRCRVIEGEVEMATNHALEDYEVEKGYILSCQSFPVTDRVVVDYDQ